MGGMDKNTEVDASDSQPYRLEWLESHKEMAEFRWGVLLKYMEGGLAERDTVECSEGWIWS